MINPKGRPEQLANCFASALLMPEKTVRSWMGEATDAAPRLPVGHAETWRSWLNDRAYSLRVSTPALQWRMVQIGLLNKKDVDPLLDWWSDPSKQQRAPLLFSQDYMRVLHAALSSGKLSVRRAAGVLDMTIDQLAALFTQYQLDVPFDI
jgi:Zn-dependent peptidase ImmA (M78 family)